MPSAHGPIFCRKELREKNRTDFFSDQKSAHRDRFFIGAILWTIAGELQLLDDVTPTFYRTEVSAHGPIFCRKQLREKIGAILYRSKSQRTRTDFHSDFLSTRKNRYVCAGHNLHVIIFHQYRLLRILDMIVTTYLYIYYSAFQTLRQSGFSRFI